MRRLSTWIPVALGALLAACGGSTDGDGGGGSGGAGGGSGNGGSAGTGGSAGCEAIAPCCDAQGNEVDPICSGGLPQCPPGSSVPPTGICTKSGCTPTEPCSGSEYCDYPDDLCGDGAAGQCKPRPRGCDLLYAPVCGCDGTVHGNACSGQSAGIDVSASGGCAAPSGFFACGGGFCEVGQKYCERAVSDVGGEPDAYACRDMPAGCGPTATCDCLGSEPCASWCAMAAPGELTLTCPGG